MIAIVDYGVGNLNSVKNAIHFIGGKAVITDRPDIIQKAEKIILPGVGAFADGMKFIKQRNLIDPLREEAVNKKKPFLGLCLGMQLLALDSNEYGLHPGLGFIKAHVRKFKFPNNTLRIPHVGWNDIIPKPNSILLAGFIQNPIFYFVHSFYLTDINPRSVKGVCNYGIDFPAVIEIGNIFATQFHPEKSQNDGLLLLKNFLDFNP